MVGAGFPTISTFCNFDPIAKRLCFRGVYAQDLAKREEEAADVVVLETPMSSRKLLRVRMNLPSDMGFGSRTDEGDRISEAKSG